MLFQYLDGCPIVKSQIYYLLTSKYCGLLSIFLRAIAILVCATKNDLMRIVVRTFSDFSVQINFYEISDKLETIFCNKFQYSVANYLIFRNLYLKILKTFATQKFREFQIISNSVD